MLEVVGGVPSLDEQHKTYSDYIKQRHLHHERSVVAADVYENMMKNLVRVGFNDDAVVASPQWTSRSDQWVKQYLTPGKASNRLTKTGTVCLCADGNKMRLVTYDLTPQMQIDRKRTLAVHVLMTGLDAEHKARAHNIGVPFLKIVYTYDGRTYSLLEVVLNFALPEYVPTTHYTPALVDEAFHDFSPLVANQITGGTREFSDACTALAKKFDLSYFSAQTANRQLFTYGDNSATVTYGSAMYALLAPAIADYVRAQFPDHPEPSLHVSMERPYVLQKLMTDAGAGDVWEAIAPSQPSIASLLTHTAGLEAVIQFGDVEALFTAEGAETKTEAKNRVLAVLKHRTVRHAPGVWMPGLINTVLLAFIHPDWDLTSFVADWAKRKNLPGATGTSAAAGTLSSLFMQPSWYSVNAGDRTEGDFYFPTVLPVRAAGQSGIGYGNWITTDESYTYITNGSNFAVVFDLRRGLSALAVFSRLDDRFPAAVVKECFRVLVPEKMPPLSIPPLSTVGAQHLRGVEELLEGGTLSTPQIPPSFYAVKCISLVGSAINSEIQFNTTAPAHRKRHVISVGDRRYNLVFDPNHVVPGQAERGGWLALDPVTHGIAGSVVLSQFTLPQSKDKAIPLVSFQGRLYGPKSLRDKIAGMTDPTSVLYKERKQDGMASGKTRPAANLVDTLYTTHYTAPATPNKTVFNEIYERPIPHQFLPEGATPDMTWV